MVNSNLIQNEYIELRNKQITLLFCGVGRVNKWFGCVPLILSDQTILCGDPKSLLVPHPKEPVSVGQLVYFVLSASLFRYFHADTVTFLGSFHGLMFDLDGIYFYF